MCKSIPVMMTLAGGDTDRFIYDSTMLAFTFGHRSAHQMSFDECYI